MILNEKNGESYSKEEQELCRKKSFWIIF